MYRQIIQAIYSLLVLLSLLGCQSVKHNDFAAFVQEPRPSVIGADYLVGVPDELVITVMSDRGVEEVAQTVGPDGKLRLKGFGIVDAAGRTCDEITSELNEIAQTTPVITSIAVRIDKFASQKVFAFGQLDLPGEQSYHGANSVLEVVAAAKPNIRADLRNVQLLRPSPDGEFRRRLTVDLDAMVRDGDSVMNVVLAAGDIVYVPPTQLGAVGLTLQQLFGSTSARMPKPIHEKPSYSEISSTLREVEHIHRLDPRISAIFHDLTIEAKKVSAEFRTSREVLADLAANLSEAEESGLVLVPRNYSFGLSTDRSNDRDFVLIPNDIEADFFGTEARNSVSSVRFWAP
ncbi:MAG: polysaccharide biosynthesis/export family protein [Planctomycetota bacterium]